MNEAGRARWIHLAGAGSLAGWVVLAAVSHRMERPLPVFLGVMAWEWSMLLAVWQALAKCDATKALRPLLAWAAAFLLCAMFAQPLMEDDQFRFLWDGWRFATSGNPYAAAPAEFFRDAGMPEKFQEILDRINYPHVPTIYGPVCQAGFLISYWIAPGELWPWKLLVVAAALGLVWLVVRVAQKRREGTAARELAWAALLIGWCPLLIFETGFNAHPDILGVLGLVAALLARLRGREATCGVLCGLAVAAKVFALPLVPFLLWRSRAAWLGGVAALLAAYAPFWLQGSGAEFAGLLAFAKEWEFNSSLHGLARWGLGVSVAKGLCGGLFVGVWAWLFLRWRRRGADGVGGEIPSGAAVFGALLLCSATVNPWYLLWLAPFVAWRPTAAGVAAMALVSLSYLTGLNLGWPALDNFAHPWWLRPAEYGGIALAAMVDVWRWTKSKAPGVHPAL